MTKTIRSVRSFALVMLLASMLWAQGNASSKAGSGKATAALAKRTATLVDDKGKATEVTDLVFHLLDTDLKRFDLDSESTPWISVRTKTFEFAIPPDGLISFEVTGQDKGEKYADGYIVHPHVEIRYLWMGREQTLSGTMQDGHFRGNSAASKFELFSNDLKAVKFSPALAPRLYTTLVLGDHKTIQLGSARIDTTLVLADGTKVRVGNLQRRYSSNTGAFTGKAGVDSGGRVTITPQAVQGYNFDNRFQFLKGSTPTTVEFSSGTSIEFRDKDEVTVALRDGTKATGTLTGHDIEPITGFTGICENGVFFIEPTLVRAIQFDLNSGARSK